LPFEGPKAFQKLKTILNGLTHESLFFGVQFTMNLNLTARGTESGNQAIGAATTFDPGTITLITTEDAVKDPTDTAKGGDASVDEAIASTHVTTMRVRASLRLNVTYAGFV